MSYSPLLLVLTLSGTLEPVPKLPLAETGRTAYTIRIHRDAIQSERHAAEELARFLHEISGATFPIQMVEDASTATGPSLCVGSGAAGGFIGPAEIASLGSDGYILRSKGNSLVIAGGRPRGTLYGVYSFLEDYLDCRWFTPKVSRIPKKERIEIRSLDRTFIPRLEYRSTDYVDARDADWAVRNKINGTGLWDSIDSRRGGNVIYGPAMKYFVHTFAEILNPKDHFRQHPEYFSEVKGKRLGQNTQLCVTNREVLRIATETVRRWMREKPEATIFSVSQNDGIVSQNHYNCCTCPDCARIAAEEGSQSGPYLRFVNAIADAVHKEFPDKAIDTLAYEFTRKSPSKTKPRSNVIVRLCNIECCFSHPLTIRAEVDKENANFARDLRGWSEISNRLYIWDYAINFAHSILPFPNLYVLKLNINFFIEHGVKGIYEEANNFSKGGEFAELRAWIIAKTLWDPNYDTDRAIDEFLDGYYEKAAVPIRRYIDLIHGKARMDELHFHFNSFYNDSGLNSPLFSADMMTHAAALFDEAEKKVADKPEVLHRVQVARLPILYVQICKLLDRREKSHQLTEQDTRLLQMALDRLDAIAHREGVTAMSEGGSYPDWVTMVKKALAPPSR